MRRILIVIFFTIILNSCKVLEIVPVTSESYDLIGKDSSFPEKSLTIRLDKDWNYFIDTTDSYCVISNKFFNHNGVLDSINYFDKDSLLALKGVYNFTSGNHGIVSAQFDKHGIKTNETRFISFRDSIVYLEDYKANTNELVSKTWAKKANFKNLWMKLEIVENKLYSEWVYERDVNGFEIVIKKKIGFDKNQDYHIFKIKYLEWDTIGNWTKRIEYDEKEPENGAILKTRYIEYFQ